MAEEAELRLRQKVVGDARSKISQTRGELQRLDSQQRTALTRGLTAARKLERGYGSLFTAIGRGGAVVGRITGAFTSLQSLIVGSAASQLAGRTYMEQLIGSNQQLESTRTVFTTMIGDADKAGQLISAIREDAASTPFQATDMLEASKRLLRLTRDSTTMNRSLLELTKTMVAINPEKSMADAAEALLDAEQGEMERLKEFGIKLTKTDLKAMRKTGESLGEVALRGVAEALTRQTGGRDVVAALSKTVEGRRSTLRDNLTELFRELGEPAFQAFGQGLDRVSEKLTQLRMDPQFKEDFADAQEVIANLTEWTFDLVTKLPQGIQKLRELIADARKFWQENETLLKGGAALLGAEYLTGGGVGRTAIGAGGRALFGSGAGGAGAAAGMMAGGIQKVFVVNMGGAMGGFGPVAGARSSGGRAATGLRGTLGSIGAQGLVGTFGAGSTAVGGAGVVTAILAFAAAMDAGEKMTKGLERNLRIADQLGKENRLTSEQLQSMRDRDTRIEGQRRARLGGSRLQLAGENFAAGGARRKSSVNFLRQRLAEASPEERQQILSQFNANIVGPTRVNATLQDGKLGFTGALSDEEKADIKRSRQISRIITENPALKKDYAKEIAAQEKRSAETLQTIQRMQETLMSVQSQQGLTIVVDGSRGSAAVDDAEQGLRAGRATLEDIFRGDRKRSTQTE